MTRLSTLVSLLFLGACAGTSVSTKYDHEVQFQTRKTFSFSPGLRRRAQPASSPQGGGAPGGGDPTGDDQAMIINSIVRKDLREAVAVELTKKGFTQVPTGGDLTIAYYINAKRRENVTRSEPEYGWDYGYGFDPGYGYGFDYARPEWDYGYSFAPVVQTETLDLREYEEGTIIIDMYDANTKRLVWRGRGVREIANTQDVNSFKVRQTVGKILAAFPPS